MIRVFVLTVSLALIGIPAAAATCASGCHTDPAPRYVAGCGHGGGIAHEYVAQVGRTATVRSMPGHAVAGINPTPVRHVAAGIAGSAPASRAPALPIVLRI